MTVRTRLAAAAVGVTLAVGAGLVVAAPAEAATISQSGFTTLASCRWSELGTLNGLKSTGRAPYAGSSCQWLGASQKYGFSILYH